MLSRTDPFIFLGPGCPTLYYPKPTPDQPALTHPLPAFIVAKSSIQPFAFIMPSMASTSASAPGTSTERAVQAGRRTGLVVDEGGTAYYYEEGAPLQPSNPLMSSSQAEWLMNTKENFVFVEAESSQLDTQAEDDLMGGDHVGGVASARGDGATASYCYPHLDYNKNYQRNATQNPPYPETFAVTESLKISTNTKGEFFLGFNETSTTFSDSAPLGSDIHDGVNPHSVILYEEIGSHDVINDSIQGEVASMNQNIVYADGLSIWEEEGTSDTFKIDLKNVLELKGVEVVESMNQSREVIDEILDMLLNDVHCLVQLRNLEEF